MNEILEEIKLERQRQDEQWGGPGHDDDHALSEWCDFIFKQNRLAEVQSLNPLRFEERMVKVAALAVAAIESSRRQRA